MGPAASQAHPAGCLARPRRTSASHRGHRHPPGGGEAAVRRSEQADLTVVVRHRRQRGGRRPLPAVLPPAFRPWAHVSPVRADPGVDQASAAGFGGGRPVDLAGDCRLHPAPARPTTGHRPPQALGEAGRAHAVRLGEFDPDDRGPMRVSAGRVSRGGVWGAEMRAVLEGPDGDGTPAVKGRCSNSQTSRCKSPSTRRSSRP